MALLAAAQDAAFDALLASPEFVRQEAGQQLLIADLIRQANAATDLFYPDHILAMPRPQDAGDPRGCHSEGSE